MGVQAIDVEPQEAMDHMEGLGITIGKAANSLKGLVVITGIIQMPCKKFKVMLQSTKGIIQLLPSQPVAQLLVISPVLDARGTQGEHFAALTMTLDNRPLWTLNIKGKPIKGLLDTGTDVSIISEQDWPPSWPLQEGDNNLVGLGTAVAPSRSAQVLDWQDQEGNTGKVQPYVCTIPITLWGRDVLTQLRIQLTSEHETELSPGWKMMKKMGYAGGGLVKDKQGIRDPTEPRGHRGKQGLGFS